MVAVLGDKIFYAGNDRLDDLRTQNTKLIDCGGKTLVPGFNDAHCHIFSLVRKLLSLNLSPPAIKSISDIKAAIKRKADTTPSGQWIIGTDYNDFYLAEKRHPNRWEMDEVSPDHPVIISHRSLHAAVLNSRALKLAGVNMEAPEPPGAYISRRATDGEPDGLVLEMLGHLRKNVLPSFSDEELDRGIKLANEYYLSQGLTSLQDATYVNDLKRWRHHHRFKGNGMLKSRVYMMCGFETLPQFIQEGMNFMSGDEWLRLGAVKLVPGMSSGQLFPSREELLHQIITAHQAGFQVAIHAVQENLVREVVEEYEDVEKQAEDFGARRHRIEHCSECPPDIINRIKRIRLNIVTHPTFAYYSGDRYLATVSPSTIPDLYPLRSLAESGIVVAAGSDSPVVPAVPVMGIYGGVMRKTSAGQEMSPEQRVRPEKVLEFYTTGAARVSHEEQIKGMIRQGMLADFALLSDDPLKIHPEAIKDIKVEMTVIGGEIAWSR